jgi:glyoxylase-like metal-dependent hydrolase (beta-lactamase superfamily II)
MKSDAHSPIVKLTPIPGITLTNVPNPVRVHDELIRPADGPANPMPCPSFLIEHDHGTVLFDAGISPKGLADPTGAFFGGLAERWGFELNPSFGIDTQLTRLGRGLTDIEFVIMSHLHYEHVGGAYLFPDATFIVGAGEFDYAYNTAGVKRSLFLPNDIEPIRGFRWVETDNDLDLFGDGSVNILQAPGHTPGSLAVAVRSQAGSFIISGDACHHRIEVETGIPCGMPDTLTATKSLRRLILLSRTWRAPIWVQHSQHHWDEYSALCAANYV